MTRADSVRARGSAVRPDQTFRTVAENDGRHAPLGLMVLRHARATLCNPFMLPSCRTEQRACRNARSSVDAGRTRGGLPIGG